MRFEKETRYKGLKKGSMILMGIIGVLIAIILTISFTQGGLTTNAWEVLVFIVAFGGFLYGVTPAKKEGRFDD